MLELLPSSPDRVFCPEETVAAVWPEFPFADDKNVKRCGYSLRRKFAEAAPGGDRLIAAEPGFGYKLILPSEAET